MNRKQRRAQAKVAGAAHVQAVPRPELIRFVIATRASREGFAATAIGRSLALNRYDFVQIRLFEENKRGLPEVYNLAIEEAKSEPAVLVFVHDDVHLLDYFW